MNFLDKIKKKLKDRAFDKMPVSKMMDESSWALIALQEKDWDTFLKHFHVNNVYLRGDAISLLVQAGDVEFLLKLKPLILELVNGENFFWGQVIGTAIKNDNVQMFEWADTYPREDIDNLNNNRIDKDKEWKEVADSIFINERVFPSNLAQYYVNHEKTDKSWFKEFAISSLNSSINSKQIKHKDAQNFLLTMLEKSELNEKIDKKPGSDQDMPAQRFKV